jgi:diguanylate cyclase (GGDEF)-like protein/PAS domain S-box-containing protein
MNNQRPRILAIDDTPANLLTIGAALSSEFDLQTATSGRVGLALAAESPPDLILLDVMMPEMDGFEVCRRLKADVRLKKIPVVFVTALGELGSEIMGLSLGAVDYLSKPINVETARQRIRNLLERESLRKQVEAQRDLLDAQVIELRQTGEMLRKLSIAVEQSPASVVITDLDAAIQYVNPRFSQITGYAAVEVIGQTPRILQSGQTPKEIYQEMWGKLTNGVPWAGELLNKRKNGELYWEEAQVAPVKDAAGAITHYVAIKTDITERKLAAQYQRIAAIAFESQEGMFITDAASAILRVNSAFTEITGYTSAEAVGQTPHLLSSGRHDAAFFGEMAASIRSNGSWQGEIWNRRKSGEVYPEWLTITAVKDDAGVVSNYVATLSDISSRKAAEDEIRNLAFYDPLTRLPNRRLLLDRLAQTLAASARHRREGALLFIDLDNFKTLNDTLGHDKGDLLLQLVAQRLLTCVREGDTVARLGGDEFVVMLEDLSEDEQEAATQAETVGEKILATLNLPYQLAGCEHHSTPSIGITLFDDNKETIDDLLKRADLAMYQAKAAGRNTLRFFDPQMQTAVSVRADLETGLRDALLKNQLVLYYQAQVMDEGRLTGVEALVRWQHPQRGLVSPIEFIPVAEASGLILPLGRWVLETACAQLALWATRPAMAHLTIAVNVSARQFHLPDFVEQVLTVLENSGANPYRLKLELTESLLVTNVEDVIIKMTALKEKGVGFSLDDFGTGYSSLSFLKRLPLDQLKIDQGFIRDILIDANDAAIANMVVALAGSMGLSVIAEGVEVEAQKDFLASQGCHAYQGYLYSRPLPLAEFEALVQDKLGEHS